MGLSKGEKMEEKLFVPELDICEETDIVLEWLSETEEVIKPTGLSASSIEKSVSDTLKRWCASFPVHFSNTWENRMPNQIRVNAESCPAKKRWEVSYFVKDELPSLDSSSTFYEIVNKAYNDIKNNPEQQKTDKDQKDKIEGIIESLRTVH